MSTSRTREKADGELFKSTGIDDNATSTAVTIDASENVLVGKTSASFGVAGVRVRGDTVGIIEATSANNMLVLNRLTSDGPMASFYKDGTTVGSIGSSNGAERLYMVNDSTGLSFLGDFSKILPCDSSGAPRDAAIDLGQGSGGRFKDLHLSGGVYLGGTGAANKLDDYEEGTWTPYGAGIDASNSVGYYTKVGNVCHTQMWILSDGATNGTISGLPFTAGHTNNAIAVGTVGYINGSVTGIVSAGQNTSISLYNGTATGSMASGNQMHCAMTYRTT